MSNSKSGVGGVASTMQTILLNKSLATMVKGIRSHKSEHGGSKSSEVDYIGKCVAEIKEELKTNFPDIKAIAVQKLLYLHMIGYDMNWAAFHVIECMSTPWFGHKRIGYLAAGVSFTKETDVILLTTHLFRKAFNSSSGGAQGGFHAQATASAEGFQYETGAAISCLANIVTPALAEELLADVYGLMNSKHPYVRKKAVLVLLKIFKAWPKALRLSFDRLKEKLGDDNQGVVSAAVYVICELASKNPKNYLSLAPQFFKILTTSSNNWVLIKVVKLLGSLVPLEPRLAKKLTEPLTDIISTTPAKSLLYECVNTLLCGELRSKTVVRLCLEKLRSFIEDADQNLKYLGLLGLHKLLQKQPRVVSEHKDLILDCLNDEDITIRMRALDLLTSMVSLKNLVGIIGKLMAHLEDNFAYISDFEWYVSILVDLTHLNGVNRENALKINQQLLDVVLRVPGVRSYTIKQMINILLANRLGSNGGSNSTTVTATSGSTKSASTSTRGHMSEVLHAVGFIIGEYTESLNEQDEDFYYDLLSHLAHEDVTRNLSSNVQNIFVQNMMKILSSALLQPFDNAQIKDQLSTVKQILPKKKIDMSGDVASMLADDGTDEMSEAPAPTPTRDEEEPLPDEEEDDFDANGLRRRKHPSLKRTFAQWHDFIARLLNILYQQLPAFTRASSVEVQERAVAYQQFIHWLITFGEFQSKITGWKGPAVVISATVPTPATAKESSSSKAAPAAASSTANVAAKLDLLSLDPFHAANQAALSIFDPQAPAPAVAAPATADSLFSSASSSSSSSSSGLSPNLKDKLRNVAIQFGLLYAERLNPVHPKAQKKVTLPKGLDLDEWINPGCEDLAKEPVSDEEDASDDPYSTKASSKKPRGGLYDDDGGDYMGTGFGAKKSRSSRNSTANSKRSSMKTGELYSYEEKPLTAEEREEAHKRQEKRRQQQANDPYYLKDTSSSKANDKSILLKTSNDKSSASSANGVNVDNIPVRRLDDDDLPNLKVVDAKSTSSRVARDEDAVKRSGKVFKVLKNDDFPDDDSDDENGKSKKKSGKDKKKSSKRDKRDAESDSDDHDALDMDLLSPLSADEVIPRMKTYAETQAEKAKAEEARLAKESKKSKKDDKDKDKDKEKDRKSKKDSKDRDSKDKKDSKDSKKESSSSKSSSSAAPAASFLDLFDTMGAAAPPGASSSSSSSSKEKEKESRKSSSSSSSSSTPAATSSSSSSSSSGDSSIRSRTLFKDSSLKVRSTCVYTSGSSVQSSLEFVLASGNSKKIAKLEKVTIELKLGKYLKSISGAQVKSSDKGATLTVRDVGTSSAVTSVVTFEFSSATLDRSYTIEGRLSYTADNGKDKERESIDLDIPLSTFIIPKKVTTSEMATLLTTGTVPSSIASAVLQLDKMKVSEVIRSIAPLLNVSLVEAVNFTATYFGRLAQSQASVAVLIKAKKGDESSVSIEIKTTNTKYSEALLEEVKHKVH